MRVSDESKILRGYRTALQMAQTNETNSPITLDARFAQIQAIENRPTIECYLFPERSISSKLFISKKQDSTIEHQFLECLYRAWDHQRAIYFQETHQSAICSSEIQDSKFNHQHLEGTQIGDLRFWHCIIKQKRKCSTWNSSKPWIYFSINIIFTMRHHISYT